MPQDVARTGAHGQANADLAGALDHADQHDVHDADPADDERNAGDGAEKECHRAGRGGGGLRDFLLVAHNEIVVFACFNPMALAKQGGDLCFHFLERVRVGGLDVDAAQVGLLADDPFHRAGVRNDDVIVLVRAAGGSAF